MPLQIPVKESGGFDLHEEDEWYVGTIVDIEELPDGQYGPGLKFIINLDGETFDDGKPRDTWAFCSQNLSPRSKLGKWIKGIVGDLPAAGQVFDLGTLIGARVKVMFEHVPGMTADGDPITREKVVAIKTAGQTQPQPQVDAQPQPQAQPQAPAATPATAPAVEPF